MARARARKIESQPAATDTETLPPGATDFEPEEYESAAHAHESARQHEFAATNHVENAERPKPGHAEQHAPSGSHAAAVDRKPYRRAPDPFGVEMINVPGNKIRLLKEEPNRETGFPGAWVIRFDVKPNDMVDENGEKYSKDRPHPVIALVKDAKHRWGFSDGDGNGGWGKEWREGHYTYAEHMDARDLLHKSAALMGAKEQSRIPD